MRVRSISFRNLRNHRSTTLAAADQVNIITGLNGAGKTTILEAISICTLTRSFVGMPDSSLITRGESGYEARLDAETDYGVPRRIQVSYTPGAGKSLTLDGASVGSAAQLIGVAPTVALSPDMKAITWGAPSERRRFMDIVISQAKRRYLEDLMDYRRIHKQRNRILSDAAKQRRSLDATVIETYDAGLIDRSARLMQQRAEFLATFQPTLRATVAEVAEGADDVELRYKPDGIAEQLRSIDDFRDALWLRSKMVWQEEQRRGMTLFGAHRDDFLMAFNGGDARVSASQGQHKTLLIGLKIAEFHYLAAQCAERPVILLDDMFGELDPERAERVYELSRNLAQVFITAASLDALPFLRSHDFGARESHVEVANGHIVSHEDVES